MAGTGTAEFRSKDRYLGLVRALPLRPIRSKQSHQQAKRMLRSLAGERGSEVADYKAVLVKLIAEYEEHAGYRIDTSTVTAAEVVRHLLSERGMSVNAFSKAIKLSQSTLSDMLNGKRAWSKSAIIKVSDFFGLNPRLFLRE